MVNWTRFDPGELELEFNEEKLAAHEVTVNEAMEVLWSGFRPLRDKNYGDRYLLLGRTDGGRPLELVAVVLGRNDSGSLRAGLYEIAEEIAPLG